MAEALGGWTTRFRRLLGLSMLLVVVILWVGSSELVQAILSHPQFNFDQPLFLTVFNSACSILLLAPHVLRRFCCGCHAPRQDDASVGDQRWLVVRLAATLGVLWFCGSVSFNFSLRRTSVATNTVLSSSSSVFTFIFSLIVLQDPFKWRSFIAVCLSIIGCTIVVFRNPETMSEDAVENTLVGDALTLLSSVLFASATVLLKKLAPPDLDVSMFFGLSGLFVLVVSPVFIFVAGVLGIEQPNRPEPATLAALGLNAVLGSTLANYLWGSAMLLLSPLVANTCLSLSIPLSAFADEVLLRQQSFSLGWMLGAGLVVAAVGLTAADLEEESPVSGQKEETSKLQASRRETVGPVEMHTLVGKCDEAR
mmetsp:Transcript_11080/g.29339  ORF Transcript_11080/g.29339 Transcript_11080/m.29339 type:complete len:366 (-) Transcript_11080:134-1231(-)